MKKNSRNIYGKANYNEDMVKSVKILVIVILILLVVYFCTALLTGEIKLGNSKEEEKVVEIQQEEIISGQIFNRSDNEYYVMLLKFTDTNASELIALKDSYSYQETHLPVYIVDLDKNFNSMLFTSNSKDINLKANNINDLKVNETTVLKIKDNKIIKSITGKDNISNEFKVTEK